MNPRHTDMAVHCRLVRELLDRGRLAAPDTLARSLGLDVPALEASLRRLAASHSLVLHPHVCEPWVVHPFSLSPTHTWVATAERGWWAPCLWCAFGICTLAGGSAVIHTRIGGEAEAVAIPVVDGEVAGASEYVVHFPEPPRLAWGNVHHFCARLLPFHCRADVEAWCDRHGFAPGCIVPLEQLARLGRLWYGHHARPDWVKVTAAEAGAIFQAVGLSGSFWEIEPREATF